MKLVVDVDGVIADQVSPVLERLNKIYRLNVTKDQIKRWDEPIADTDIKTEIEKSLLDKKFVLSLKLIDNAREALNQLAEEHEIIIATNRAPVVDQVTQEWLKKNGIPYHHYVNTSTSGKGTIVGDILIDDYPGNVLEFSAKGRLGILFEQPWNEYDPLIESAIAQGRIIRAHGWIEVVEIINSLSSLKKK